MDSRHCQTNLWWFWWSNRSTRSNTRFDIIRYGQRLFKHSKRTTSWFIFRRVLEGLGIRYNQRFSRFSKCTSYVYLYIRSKMDINLVNIIARYGETFYVASLRIWHLNIRVGNAQISFKNQRKSEKCNLAEWIDEFCYCRTYFVTGIQLK